MGSHLARALIAAGHAVRVFDRPDRNLLPGYPLREEVEWQEGDFVNPKDTARALAGCDVVFHLVSTTLPGSANDNPVYDVESNFLGTLRMLDAALQSGVKKVVFSSSGGTVYGVPQTIPITETHPTEPITAYGIGKLMIEKYLHLYHVLHGLDYVVLRVANPFGEGQRVTSGQGAVTTFLRHALSGRPVDIWGDGSVVRDYLYVGDVAQAFTCALDHEPAERIVNIGSGTGRSLHEIVDAIETFIGRKVERRYFPGRPFDVPANVLEISRARSALDWMPRTPLEEGLRRTAAWLRQELG